MTEVDQNALRKIDEVDKEDESQLEGSKEIIKMVKNNVESSSNESVKQFESEIVPIQTISNDFPDKNSEPEFSGEPQRRKRERAKVWYPVDFKKDSDQSKELNIPIK
mmetsp:Transcript_30825/g.27266  ORF Transcript_30825/g.27266 Transcript_30825/m.27266 type:complete len:107 (+) Transcript_30825:21-341(+)